jgi:DNA-binding LacI/PurR family transcriptional regulator
VIAGLADDSSAAERLQGVRATLDAAGLRLPHERCHAGDFGIASGREGAHALLGGPDPPTALFVANNLMTVGAMRGIADLGLRIPDDVSLVGFDDMDWYPLASPPITAVAQPAHEIGRRAARRLLERIRGTRRSRPRTELLPTELIVRASTAPPRRQRLRRQNPTRKEHP